MAAPQDLISRGAGFDVLRPLFGQKTSPEALLTLKPG
jgi:hypothetical protein